MDDRGFIGALESEATQQLSAIREYRTYQGNNAEFRNRAKVALGVIGAYVRLRATVANEHTNRLVERRMGLRGGEEQTALPPAE